MYTLKWRIVGDEDNFYAAWQAAEVLGVSAQRVYELIDEGKLEALRDEETGRWLIDARSVHSLGELPPEPPEARGSRVRTREGNRADSWILVVIAVVTLLAASYTLITVLAEG
jgi:excisionase family DNA binding protein